MKSYQIHFIRHGITDGNLEGRYIGSTDLSLCEEGIAQIKELTERYEYPGAAAFITSPMKRCTETMELIYPGVPPLVIRELRECDFGDFEGRTAEELAECDDFAQWMTADSQFAPYGGESGEHFAERVCSVFEEIVEGLMKTGTTSTVILTHGGVIATLLSRYGLPQADPSQWACEPGCGYTVRIHPQLWMSGKVFEVCSRLPYERDDEDSDE